MSATEVSFIYTIFATDGTFFLSSFFQTHYNQNQSTVGNTVEMRSEQVATGDVPNLPNNMGGFVRFDSI